MHRDAVHQGGDGSLHVRKTAPPVGTVVLVALMSATSADLSDSVELGINGVSRVVATVSTWL